MKKIVSLKCLSFILALIFVFNLETPIFAAMDIYDYNSIYDTSTAPKDYLPKDSAVEDESLMIKAFAMEDESTEERVLLVEDKLPWNSDANSLVLNSLGIKYEKVSTANFLKKDLSKYSVVVFANDQQFSAYNNYVQFKEYLELFAEVGGVIVFGACDQGWANGTMNTELPGNVKKLNRYTARNYIEDYTHPIVTAELTNMISLLDSDLYSNYCSHTYFIEDTLPPGSKVILRDSDIKAPTLVEYPLGNGRVIASGLTWEHSYVYHTTDSYGHYARKAMKDMFSYAIRVSDISTEGLELLKGYYLKANAHCLFVADKDTELPIENSYAEVNGNKYIANENGIIEIYEEPGEYEVTVYAEGYRNNKLKYELKRGSARIFLMENDPKDGKPYATMILGKTADSNNIYDLKTQRMYFSQGDTIDCEIEIDVEWNGNGEGSVCLFQLNDRPVILKNETKFTIKPGIDFDPNEKVYIFLICDNDINSKSAEIGLVINKKTEAAEKVDENLQEIQNNYNISLGENETGIFNDNDFANFFPSDFTLEVPNLPMKISVKQNLEDGTLTLKGIIGLENWSSKEDNLDKFLNSPGEWKTFKEAFDKVKNNFGYNNSKTEYLNNKTALKALEDELKITNSFKARVEGFGYIEAKLNANYEPIRFTGGVIVNANMSYTYGNTFMAGPIPLYYEITGKLAAELTGDLKFYDVENGPSIDATFSITPELILGAGVGISGIATIGLEGGAKLKMQLLPDSKGTFTPYVKLRMFLLFLFDFRLDLVSKDFELWPTANPAAPINLFNMLRINNGNSDDIKLLSMDYLQNTSLWNDKSKLLNDSTIDISPLQEYILPSTVPQIEKYDDKYIIVFQTNIEDRKSVNSIGLMYSIYENGEWSNPLSVWDTGTNDLYFNMIEKDNEVYLVWQKITSDLDSDDITEILITMLENSEICYAKFDKKTNTFIQQSFITENKTMDMQPILVVNENNITAIWVSNKENDVFGFSDNDIMISILSDGTWSEPEILSTVNGYVSEVAAANINGSLKVTIVSIDANGNNCISTINDGSMLQVISDENIKNGIKYNADKLYWVSNGVLYENSYDMPISIGDGSVISASYKFVENNDISSIVWLSDNKLYASIKCDNKWGNPINLLDASKYFSETTSIYDYDINLSSNNEWSIILKNYDNEKDMTSLVHILVKPIDDISLIYVDVEDSNRVDGVQPVELYITNNSQNCIEKFNLKVEDLNGQVYFDDEIYYTLNPGETTRVTQEVKIGKLVQQTDFNVTVKTDSEVDLSDNSLTVSLGYINVGMTADRYENSNTLIMSVNVYNKSYTPADITINLIEDKIDGITIDMKNIGFLDYETSYLYNFSIDKSKIDFGDSDVKYYYLRLDTSEYNPYEENSTFIIVIYKEDYDKDDYDDPIIKPDDNQSISDCELSYTITGNWDNYNNVEVTIKNIGCQPVDGWFVDLKTNGEIENIWNLQIIHHKDELYSLKALNYNSIIYPNSSITFGFIFKGNVSDLDSMLLYQNRVTEEFEVNIDVEIIDDWQDGFTGQIIISNFENYPLENWILTFNADFDILTLWPCELIKNANGSYSIRGINNSCIIQEQSSIVIGFNGAKSNDNCTITDVKLEVNRY